MLVIKRWRLEINTRHVLKTVKSPNNSIIISCNSFNVIASLDFPIDEHQQIESKQMPPFA